jgi:hypothetical protein
MKGTICGQLQRQFSRLMSASIQMNFVTWRNGEFFHRWQGSDAGGEAKKTTNSQI